MRKFLIGALAVTALVAVPAIGGTHDVGGVMPAGACGGDLGGTFPNCTVDVPVTSAAKVDGANGDLTTISTATCASGFFYDINGGGTQGATEPCAAGDLVQVASEVDIRYSTSREVLYADEDQDGSKENGDQVLGHKTGDGLFRWRECHPEDFDVSGSVTDGIQECIAELEARGDGGIVKLANKTYGLTGSVAITITTAGEEITIEGAGRGASFISCTVSLGCTAPWVIQTSVNKTRLANFAIVRDSAGGGIDTCMTTGYPNHVVIENVDIDGDSAASAGSRTGTDIGIKWCGTLNTISGGTIRWFGDGIRITANTSGGATANHIQWTALSSVDDCITTTVGNDVANVGDSLTTSLTGVACQTFYRYGIYALGGSSDAINQNNFALDGETYFELGDTAIYVDGSASAYDPIIHAEEMTVGTTADVAGSASKPDANSTTDGLVLDSDTNSDAYWRGGTLSATNCITMEGTGRLFYWMDSQSASPCAPTMTGGVLVDFDSMLPFAVTKATASSTAITNTTTETAFSTCFYTVPANSVAIGSTFRITAGGIISTDAVTSQIAIRARWGAVNTDPLLLDLGPTTLALGGATSDGFTVNGLVTIRTIGAAGTAVGTGAATIASVASNGDSDVISDNQASTTTIDTTAATALTLFADWTTADTDNTITAETCVIERVQ